MSGFIIRRLLRAIPLLFGVAILSFLGFGVPSETPTWGNMLNSARSSYLTHPLLTIAVLSINFIGDGLRDGFDPRASR